MRVVLDTDVIVAALRSAKGASRRLLAAVLDGRLTLLLSVPLMIEYEAVLLRREHLLKAGVTAQEVGFLLDALAAVCEQVEPDFLWRPMLQDADDEMVLETAINGRAGTLVTFNKRDFGEAASQFGIRLATPGEALALTRLL